jgi:fermentation-respiration switch protein FrsA (DUF1100 family)
VILVEVVFLAVFWSWVFAAVLFLRNTVLPRLPLTTSPSVYSLASETVRFQATDGLTLEGWKILSESSQPWILLCHGVGSNRADLLEIAAALHTARFNLLLFDFRAHGGSAGRSTSFGWQEQRDVEGALAYLGGQEDIPEKPYGIYGISMGGAVALMVAGRDERLAAIAVDSPYLNLEESLARHATLLYPWIPRQPFLWFVLATYRIRFGVWPRQVTPQVAAGQLGSRPLLVIQGAHDPRMPLEGAKQLVQSASGPADLWTIEHAGHLEAFSFQPDAYRERLVRFFDTYLK